MAIEQNDGVYTKFPVPTDLKTYVGDGPTFKFATKEDIPSAYRFVGMRVNEYLNDTWKEYRLESNLSLWTEIVSSQSLTIQQNRILNIVAENNIIYTVDSHKYTNSLVFINGILITNNSYSMEDAEVQGEPKSKITFQFPLELNDVVITVKF